VPVPPPPPVATEEPTNENMLNSPLEDDDVGRNDGGDEDDVDGVVTNASHSSIRSEGRVTEGRDADMAKRKDQK